MAFIDTTRKIRRSVVLVTVVGSSVLCYAGFEIGIRTLVLPSLSAGIEARATLQHIEAENMTIDEFVTDLETSYGDRNFRLDPQLV